jgi:hypothetical protein
MARLALSLCQAYEFLKPLQIQLKFYVKIGLEISQTKTEKCKVYSRMMANNSLKLLHALEAVQTGYHQARHCPAAKYRSCRH